MQASEIVPKYIDYGNASWCLYALETACSKLRTLELIQVWQSSISSPVYMKLQFCLKCMDILLTVYNKSKICTRILYYERRKRELPTASCNISLMQGASLFVAPNWRTNCRLRFRLSLSSSPHWFPRRDRLPAIRLVHCDADSLPITSRGVAKCNKL